MEDEIDPNLSPELKDIINRIKAYNIVHPEGIFVYNFLGWKKCEDICPDCGEHCDCIDENKSMLGAFGDLNSVRQLINGRVDAMREIKFRAWGKSFKKMYLPGEWSDLLININGSLFCQTDIAENSGLMDVDKNDFEIMQFTGLLDKNGKEIYEGDIVKLDTWTVPHRIVFIEGAFCLAFPSGEYAADIHYIHHAGIKQATIIGNIYENPEFIGGVI